MGSFKTGVARSDYQTRRFEFIPITPLAATGSGAPEGSVANFAQEVLKGQLPRSVRGLSSQGVEQFGRSEALVSLLDHPGVVNK